VLGVVRSDPFQMNQKIQVGANGQPDQLRAGVIESGQKR
jgi:hypothetical protein